MAFVYARNTVTGKIVKVPEHYLTHPVFGKGFVAADKDGKDYLPALYRPKTSEEFTQTRKYRKKETDTVPKEDVISEAPEVTDGA